MEFYDSAMVATSFLMEPRSSTPFAAAPWERHLGRLRHTTTSAAASRERRPWDSSASDHIQRSTSAIVAAPWDAPASAVADAPFDSSSTVFASDPFANKPFADEPFADEPVDDTDADDVYEADNTFHEPLEEYKAENPLDPSEFSEIAADFSAYRQCLRENFQRLERLVTEWLEERYAGGVSSTAVTSGVAGSSGSTPTTLSSTADASDFSHLDGEQIHDTFHPDDAPISDDTDFIPANFNADAVSDGRICTDPPPKLADLSPLTLGDEICDGEPFRDDVGVLALSTDDDNDPAPLRHQVSEPPLRSMSRRGRTHDNQAPEMEELYIDSASRLGALPDRAVEEDDPLDDEVAVALEQQRCVERVLLPHDLLGPQQRAVGGAEAEQLLRVPARRCALHLAMAPLHAQPRLEVERLGSVLDSFDDFTADVRLTIPNTLVDLKHFMRQPEAEEKDDVPAVFAINPACQMRLYYFDSGMPATCSMQCLSLAVQIAATSWVFLVTEACIFDPGIIIDEFCSSLEPWPPPFPLELFHGCARIRPLPWLSFCYQAASEHRLILSSNQCPILQQQQAEFQCIHFNATADIHILLMHCFAHILSSYIGLALKCLSFTTQDIAISWLSMMDILVDTLCSRSTIHLSGLLASVSKGEQTLEEVQTCQDFQLLHRFASQFWYTSSIISISSLLDECNSVDCKTWSPPVSSLCMHAGAYYMAVWVENSMISGWSRISGWCGFAEHKYWRYVLHAMHWKFCDREMFQQWDPGISLLSGITSWLSVPVTWSISLCIKSITVQPSSWPIFSMDSLCFWDTQLLWLCKLLWHYLHWQIISVACTTWSPSVSSENIISNGCPASAWFSWIWKPPWILLNFCHSSSSNSVLKLHLIVGNSTLASKWTASTICSASKTFSSQASRISSTYGGLKSSTTHKRAKVQKYDLQGGHDEIRASDITNKPFLFAATQGSIGTALIEFLPIDGIYQRKRLVIHFFCLPRTSLVDCWTGSELLIQIQLAVMKPLLSSGILWHDIHGVQIHVCDIAERQRDCGFCGHYSMQLLVTSDKDAEFKTHIWWFQHVLHPDGNPNPWLFFTIDKDLSAYEFFRSWKPP